MSSLVAARVSVSVFVGFLILIVSHPMCVTFSFASLDPLVGFCSAVFPRRLHSALTSCVYLRYAFPVFWDVFFSLVLFLVGLLRNFLLEISPQ